MKIGIIGASGKAGQFLAGEALERGYGVTALVRDKSKITDPRLLILERDIFVLTPEDCAGFNAVIDAFKAPEGKEEQHLTSMEHLIAVFGQLPGVRLLVVGGAGSLFTDAGMSTRLMDTPSFPTAFLPTASSMGKAFEKLQASTVAWTYLSPAAEFDPRGRRTGFYTLGGDVMIRNRSGESYVSYADYAVAMIDEIRDKAHVGKRFTVVSEKN